MKLSDIKRLMRYLPNPHTTTDQTQHNAILRQLGLEPGDLYQELEMESPYVDTHRDVSFSNAYVNLHSHTFYELLYCRNTCGAEYLVGTERYRLQKGDIIMVLPGVSHRPLLPEHMTEPYRRDVLWLSQDFLENTAKNYPKPPFSSQFYTPLLRTAGTKWEYLGDLFYNGVAESERQQPGWELAVLGNTMILLTHLRRAYEDRHALPLKAETPELIDQVVAYIEDNLSQKITLEDISRHFFVSGSTISQTFRNKMGVSFYRHVTQRRLIASKLLIMQGKPLEQISREVGFTDYSAFYRAFKQEYGISPRQFRKLQENTPPLIP